MPEEKIKIKDLAGELDVQSKDMLRALRDLGLPAKTTAGSVSVEGASATGASAAASPRRSPGKKRQNLPPGPARRLGCAREAGRGTWGGAAVLRTGRGT